MQATKLATVRRMCVSGEAKRIRETSRVSLSEAAAEIAGGVSPPTVHRWENAKRLPRGEQAEAYLAFLIRLKRLAERAS